MHDFDIYPKLPKLKARKERKIILVLSLRKAALPSALLGCDAHETNNKKSWRVNFPAALVTQPTWRSQLWVRASEGKSWLVFRDVAKAAVIWDAHYN